MTQAETLRKTLAEKAALKELQKTEPEKALALMLQKHYRSTHREPGISSKNRYQSKKHRKTYCETCGATQKLLVHHINRNQSDNRPENLQTLCPACHHEIHRPRKRRDWE